MPEQNQIESPEGRTDHTSPKGCSSGCATTIAVLIFIACLLALAIPMVVRMMIRQTMTPAEITAMNDFRRKPLTIPKSWQEVTPFPRDVLDSQIRLQKITDPQYEVIRRELDNTTTTSTGFTNLQAGRTVSEDQWSSISALLIFASAQLEETSAGVQLAGYEFAAMPDTKDPDYLGITLLNSKLWLLAAHQYARNGDWSMAFESALMPLRRVQRHPASSITQHAIGIAVEQIALRTINLIAAKCPDVAALRTTLQELNQLDPKLHHDAFDSSVVVDAFAQLRQFKRLGYPVNLSSGKPAQFYTTQRWRAAYDFPGWILKRLGPGDPRRIYYEAQVASMKSTRGITNHGYYLALAQLYFVPELLYRNSQPNYTGVSVREKSVRANFDLTRLQLVTRLHNLDGRPVGGDIKTLIATSATNGIAPPDFLPTEPKDPFTSKSLLWDSAKRQFYSVGPDKFDDKSRLPYDPTNGSISPGDIAVRD